MKRATQPIELLQWKSPLELQLFVRLDGALVRLEDLRSELQQPAPPEKRASMERYEEVTAGSVAG